MNLEAVHLNFATRGTGGGGPLARNMAAMTSAQWMFAVFIIFACAARLAIAFEAAALTRACMHSSLTAWQRHGSSARCL